MLLQNNWSNSNDSQITASNVTAILTPILTAYIAKKIRNKTSWNTRSLIELGNHLGSHSEVFSYLECSTRYVTIKCYIAKSRCIKWYVSKFDTKRVRCIMHDTYHAWYIWFWTPFNQCTKYRKFWIIVRAVVSATIELQVVLLIVWAGRLRPAPTRIQISTAITMKIALHKVLRFVF